MESSSDSLLRIESSNGAPVTTGVIKSERFRRDVDWSASVLACRDYESAGAASAGGTLALHSPAARLSLLMTPITTGVIKCESRHESCQNRER